MKAIDVHGHIGRCNNHNYDLNDQLMTTNIETIRKRAKKNEVKITIVSSLDGLMPYGGNPIEGNKSAFLISEEYSDIKFWIIIDPRKKETYKQATLINKNQCLGIKIHPTLHEYSIFDYGDEIFQFAEKNNMIILTHSGCGTNPEDVTIFANRYKNVKLILAHLGSSEDGKLTRQINAIQQSRWNNIYTDTSSGCSIYSGLIEHAVKKIGSKNILFGSDTPLHFTGCIKARIEQAEITKKEKEDILFNNSNRLFNLNI